ncbi:alpha/beta fold hydrolase [Leifsonia sp. NPDC080035]|uniref:Alpha/beta fold hydrolase n=1 Tax=Leifsonia sp. NPDC080035 TaxID=3143936 RepID=A0AAU7G9A0_9MICO
MAALTSPDGTVIDYEIAGPDDAPAVVLVDGAMCFRDSGPMRSIADALAPELRVVLYDRRGRGASTDTVPFSVHREVEDIAALVDAVGGRAAVFGMSSGGALALAAASELGQGRVTKVAVYEPPFMPEPAIPAAAAYTEELTATLAAGDRERAVEFFLRRVGVPDAGIEGMRGSPTWAATVALAPTLAYDDAALGDSRVPAELLRDLPVPVLALAGGASPEFLRFGAERVAEEARDGRYAVVDGQTHDVGAAPLAAHLLAFLRP